MLNEALTSDHIRDFVREVGQHLTYWNLHRLTLEEKQWPDSELETLGFFAYPLAAL